MLRGFSGAQNLQGLGFRVFRVSGEPVTFS